MEGDQRAKNENKPVGYTPLPFAPAHVLESEKDMSKIEKTKLQNAHTFWVNIKDQGFKAKKNQAFDENELMEIETVDTVSIKTLFSFIYLSVNKKV